MSLLLEPRPESGAISRRSALRMMAGSGIAGAAWGTGFTALSGIRRASATIAGANDWQVTLIESGRSRALFVVGIPDASLGDTLARMMGSFRQRIDLIVGSSTALERLPSSYRSRWNVQRTIVLGGTETRSLSARTASIAWPKVIELGQRLTISIVPVIRGQWMNGEQPLGAQARWIVSAEGNGSTIRLAERLEDIAGMIDEPSTVVIAPSGDLRGMWAFDPSSAIAVNSDHIPQDVTTSPDHSVQGGHWLVSVFANDFAHLALTDRGVGLPHWARSIEFIDRPG